mgnify:CR=1 FL=1
MGFYENTIVAKQDLAEKELKTIKDKYNELINSTSGKVLKIEEWGLLNLANKIKSYKKGFYIHYKFEGNKNTLSEIDKKMKVDKDVSKVSIIGVGMITTPGVTYRMFQALSEKKINIMVISTSEIKISVLISKKHLVKAVAALHKEFGLNK